MKEVVDRIVQYPNRYKLTDVSTGKELGTYDFTEVPGTVQQEGTEINKELFDSIEADIEAAGNFNPSGTYPNLTVGAATNATNDAQGRNIADTYALKGEGGKLYKHTILFNGARNDDTNNYVSLYGVLFLTTDTPFTSDDYDSVVELLRYTPFSAYGTNPNDPIRYFSGTFSYVGESGGKYVINTYCTGASGTAYTRFLQSEKSLTDTVTEV